MPSWMPSPINREPTVWRLPSVCQAPPTLAASAKDGISSSAACISACLLFSSDLPIGDFGWVGVEEVEVAGGSGGKSSRTGGNKTVGGLLDCSRVVGETCGAGTGMGGLLDCSRSVVVALTSIPAKPRAHVMALSRLAAFSAAAGETFGAGTVGGGLLDCSRAMAGETGGGSVPPAWSPSVTSHWWLGPVWAVSSQNQQQ